MTGWAAALAFAVAVRAGSVGWGLIALAIAAAQIASLYLWPFAPCRACRGTGRNSGSSKRGFGECRRCQGTGRRQRPRLPPGAPRRRLTR